MDIRQLRYFVGIVDSGSFSAASIRLGVAQPSLSQHVLQIEKSLGVELLVRTARGVTLTESGQNLYARAIEIIRAFDGAIDELRDRSLKPNGQVTFAFPSSVSNVLTVPLAETVRHEFPQVVLRAMDAMSGHVQQWLTEAKIDFGVLYDVNAVRHLQVTPLLVEDLYLVASADSWKGEINADGSAQQAIDLADCARLDLILPHRTHGLRDLIERFARAHCVALNVAMEIDSLSQIKSIVERGSGFSILAHAAVNQEVMRGAFVLVPIRNPAIRRTVYLATNPERRLTRAAKEIQQLAMKIVIELVQKGLWRGQLIASADASQSRHERQISRYDCR